MASTAHGFIPHLAPEEAARAELEDGIDDVVQRGADAGAFLPVQRADRRRRQIHLRGWLGWR